MTALEWLRRAVVIEQDECILWPFGVNTHGYGNVYVAGRTRSAHRTAWVLAGRLLPPRPNELRHTCDVRHCVNLRHLVPGTKKQNYNDARERGRNSRGEIHGRSKLTQAAVREIRRSGKSQRTLAREFGVSQRAIWMVIHGKTWPEVEA